MMGMNFFMIRLIRQHPIGWNGVNLLLAKVKSFGVRIDRIAKNNTQRDQACLGCLIKMLSYKCRVGKACQVSIFEDTLLYNW